MTHIPYRGVPLMVQDMLAGTLDLAFVPLGGTLLAQLDKGRIRAYGVTAAAPHRLLPQAAGLRSTGAEPAPAQTLAELDHFYVDQVLRYQALARSIPVTLQQ